MRLRDRVHIRYKQPPSANNDPLAHAMAMVAVPTLFGFLGHLLDQAVGTGPVFLLVFATVGVVASFLSAYYRYEARMAQHEADKPWNRKEKVA